MNIADLQKLAAETRLSRETGMALLIASGLLAIFLFIPLAGQRTTEPPVAVASSTPDAFANVPVTAKAAVVYDLATGETLYARNADAQLPLASLTKLLTVYTALAELSPATPITVSANATAVEGSHVLREGQTFALGDLARLTLTASLNDGAVAMSEAAAAREGTTQAAALASAASALDLAQTYAVNGSGLDESTTVSGGYGSARDLAKLAGALVATAPAVALATTESSTQATSAGGTTLTVKNTDPMTGSLPRLLLSKTGYTELAGGNLALVFDAGINHPVAVVVLGSTQKERFTDGAALVAATLAHFAGVASL